MAALWVVDIPFSIPRFSVKKEEEAPPEVVAGRMDS